MLPITSASGRWYTRAPNVLKPSIVNTRAGSITGTALNAPCIAMHGQSDPVQRRTRPSSTPAIVAYTMPIGATWITPKNKALSARPALAP
jgi:hypothetical protein